MRALRHRLIAAVVGAAVVTAGCTTSSPTPAQTTAAPTTSSTPSSPSVWRVAQGPSGALEGWLDGVDCVTATSCVAVGNETGTNGPTKVLVETLRDGSWSATNPPPPPRSEGGYLFSVSCPAVGACVAVGYFFTPVNGGGTGTMLIETLHGGKWSVSSTPALGSAFRDSFLYGVSCTAATSCVAVGNTDHGDASTDLPLIVTLSGGSWSVTSSPSVGGQGGLLAVTCPVPATCVATGYRASSSAIRTLVETRTEGSWSLTPSPGSGKLNPLYGARGLNAVSCVSPASCVAVGQLSGPGPVVDTASGQGWSSAPSPRPAAADGASGLYGVSCTAPTACVAVGSVAAKFGSDAPDGAFGFPLGLLIETGSGRTWELSTNPSAVPAHSGLHAVSCVGLSCVAVGQSGQFTSPTSVLKTLIVQTP